MSRIVSAKVRTRGNVPAGRPLVRNVVLPSGFALLVWLAASCGAGPSPASTPPDWVEVTVYFTDRDAYAVGVPPFEVGVTRLVPASSNIPEAVLEAFFAGPALEEEQRGLMMIASGFQGVLELEISDGVARVFLSGECSSQGATYTVAQPIHRNLLQFPEVRAVKIFDEDRTTEDPLGEGNSIPACLEP